ncbi:alpha/beta-Hydrolases superfamily protein [Perilla frutescens var. frutescens]|nr:alpha/beta-Hydrolases superfamily protein [Perilla frutescens var. frutescens]
MWRPATRVSVESRPWRCGCGRHLGVRATLNQAADWRSDDVEADGGPSLLSAFGVKDCDRSSVSFGVKD